MRVYFFIIALILLLFFRFFLFFNSAHYYKEGEHIVFETYLISEPKLAIGVYTFSANLENGQRVFTRTNYEHSLNFGDKIRVEGVVKNSENSPFSNQGILVLENLTNPIFLDFPKISIQKEENLLFSFINPIRGRVVENVRREIPPNLSGLLLGIVFGLKTYIPDSFYDALKQAGVLHVIAASGMNVTMVGAFLVSLFGRFMRRQIALALGILGIWFYALFAGAEPSIMRAAIMISFALIGEALGRQYSGLYGLFLAGFIMLFVKPILLWDIGFQLSFLATFGIMQAATYKVPNLFSEDLKVTLSAQIFTLPVILFNFGSYSPFSIVSNILVLWTVPFLMILGALGSISGLVLKPLDDIFLFLSLPMLWYFEKIVLFFGTLPVIELTTFPWQFAVSLWLITFAILSFIRIRTKDKIDDRE